MKTCAGCFGKGKSYHQSRLILFYFALFIILIRERERERERDCNAYVFSCKSIKQEKKRVKQEKEKRTKFNQISSTEKKYI